MKLKQKLIISVILYFLVIPVSHGADTTGISVGPLVWYAWWDPFFKDDLRYTYSAQVHPRNRHIKSKFSMSPAFLFGPALSIDFLGRWAVSGIYMTSDRYKGKRSDANADGGTGLEDIANTYFTVDKSDLDASVSCRIIGWLKIFAGFKWQRYDFREKIYIAQRGVTCEIYTDYAESNGYGAGVGLGATIPIIDNLYVLANVSGLYLRTRVTIRSEQIRINTLGFPYPRLYLEKDRFNIYGGNINSSIAYYISAISTTVSLGFRYQFLRYYTDNITNDLYASFPPVNTLISQMTYKSVREGGYNHTWDHFYGVAFSAIYTLEIAGTKKKGS